MGATAPATVRAGREPTLEQEDATIAVSDGRSRFVIDSATAQTRWEAADGKPLVESAPASGREPLLNLDYQQNDNRRDGIDQAYPGLPDISYRAYAYAALRRAGSRSRPSTIPIFRATPSVSTRGPATPALQD